MPIKSLRVVFDIQHPSDVNVFKPVVVELKEMGHIPSLICLARGRVPQIARMEMPKVAQTIIGVHCSGRIGLYIRTGLWRELRLLAYMAFGKVDVAVGQPGFQTALAGKMLGFRGIGIYDDPEHGINHKLSMKWCDPYLLPECLSVQGESIRSFKGLKEWGYLSPKRFTPSIEYVRNQGLSPFSYFFLREIAPRSLNYLNETHYPIKQLYDQGLCKHPAVISLEDPTRRSLFPKWKVLKEPVEDIHSIMFFSKACISSGDSMVREGAQLGVKSIYMGKRLMQANKPIIEMGLLRHVPSPQIALEYVLGLERDDTSVREGVRDMLQDLWDDPVDLLLDAIVNEE